MEPWRKWYEVQEEMLDLAEELGTSYKEVRHILTTGQLQTSYIWKDVDDEDAPIIALTDTQEPEDLKHNESGGPYYYEVITREEVERFKASHKISTMATVADQVTPPTVAKSAKTRTDISLMKMVIGMAIKGYRYNPDDKRSDVPQEIANDLHVCGVPLDVDTVRKWLHESAQLLEGQAI